MLSLYRYFNSLPRISRQLVLNTFFTSSAVFMISPYMITYLPSFTDITHRETALSIGVGVAIGSLLALGFSSFFQRHNDKKTGFLCCLGLGFSYFFFAFTQRVDTSWVFCTVSALFLFQRFFLNTLTTCTRSIQILQNEGKDTQKLFWLISLTFSLGVTIGPQIGAFFISKYSFRDSLLLASFLIFLCAINYLFLLKSPQKDKKISLLETNSHFEFAATISCLASVISYGIYAQIFSFVPLVITENFPHSSVDTIRWFFFVYAIFRIASAVWAYPKISKILKSSSHIFFLGTSICVLSLFVISLNVGATLLLLMASTFAIGESLFASMAVPWITSYIRDKNAVRIHVGLFTFASTAVGIGGGQVLGTMIFESGSSHLANVTWIAIYLVFIFLYWLAERKSPSRVSIDLPCN